MSSKKADPLAAALSKVERIVSQVGTSTGPQFKFTIPVDLHQEYWTSLRMLEELQALLPAIRDRLVMDSNAATAATFDCRVRDLFGGNTVEQSMAEVQAQIEENGFKTKFGKKGRSN